MSRLKKPHRPWWATGERSSNAAEHLWHELKTRGSRLGQAQTYDGLDSLGRPKFRPVPTRLPRNTF